MELESLSQTFSKKNISLQVQNIPMWVIPWDWGMRENLWKKYVEYIQNQQLLAYIGQEKTQEAKNLLPWYFMAKESCQSPIIKHCPDKHAPCDSSWKNPMIYCFIQESNGIWYSVARTKALKCKYYRRLYLVVDHF